MDRIGDRFVPGGRGGSKQCSCSRWVNRSYYTGQRIQVRRIAHKIGVPGIFEWYIERFGLSWNLPNIFVERIGEIICDMQPDVNLGAERCSEGKLAANRVMLCPRTARILETLDFVLLCLLRKR